MRGSANGDVVDLLPQVEPTWSATPYLLARTAVADVRTYERAPSGAAATGPVFVIGSPRSGTTFLGQALSSVPGMSYHFEPIAIKAFLPYVYLGLWHEARSKLLIRGVHHMLTAIHRDWRRTLVEKQPSAVFIADRLHRWYPTARFVVLQRDGRDVTASWAERPWFQPSQPEMRVEPGGYLYGPVPHFWVESNRVKEFRSTTTEHRCAWGWRRHVEVWHQVRREIPTEAWIEIRYEALVSDPGAVADELSTFLGFTDHAGRVLADNLKSADRRSVGRWQTAPVSSDERALREIAPLLKDLGYR